MRTCKQCQLQMEEGYRIEVNTYGVPKIKKATAKPDEIKVAICPNCSEISLYIK